MALTGNNRGQEREDRFLQFYKSAQKQEMDREMGD